MKNKPKNDIMPIGPLMVEHRLIERMVALLEKARKKMRDTNSVNTGLLNSAVDFFKIYADLCHHGKEEDILFKELDARTLAPADKAMLDGLKSDHARARGFVAQLSAGLEEICGKCGSASAASIAAVIRDLTALYRAHIRKEDKQFFIPVMRYFNKEEQAHMLSAFWDFDQALIHKKYKSLVSHLEEGEGL